MGLTDGEREEKRLLSLFLSLSTGLLIRETNISQHTNTLTQEAGVGTDESLSVDPQPDQRSNSNWFQPCDSKARHYSQDKANRLSGRQSAWRCQSEGGEEHNLSAQPVPLCPLRAETPSSLCSPESPWQQKQNLLQLKVSRRLSLPATACLLQVYRPGEGLSCVKSV